MWSWLVTAWDWFWNFLGAIGFLVLVCLVVTIRTFAGRRARHEPNRDNDMDNAE